MSEAGALAHEKKGMTVILDAGIATAKNGDGACGWIWIWIWIWICHSKLLLGRALLEAGKNKESDAIFNACIQENPDIKAQVAVFKTMALG
jgi:hypothetical protein